MVALDICLIIFAALAASSQRNTSGYDSFHASLLREMRGMSIAICVLAGVAIALQIINIFLGKMDLKTALVTLCGLACVIHFIAIFLNIIVLGDRGFFSGGTSHNSSEPPSAVWPALSLVCAIVCLVLSIALAVAWGGCKRVDTPVSTTATQGPAGGLITPAPDSFQETPGQTPTQNPAQPLLSSVEQESAMTFYGGVPAYQVPPYES